MAQEAMFCDDKLCAFQVINLADIYTYPRDLNRCLLGQPFQGEMTWSCVDSLTQKNPFLFQNRIG